MFRPVHFAASLTVLTIAGLLVLGSTLTGRVHAAPAAPALVHTASARILVDAHGMTLYVFAPDKQNKSVCYGECAVFWPPAIVPTGTTVPTRMPGITGKFGVTVRTNGKHQLTFDGAPLYTFIKDKKPGDMKGQGSTGSGGYWWIVVAPRA
jgi:predicted lipoprotein with Yx(FWY)xxD motif